MKPDPPVTSTREPSDSVTCRTLEAILNPVITFSKIPLADEFRLLVEQLVLQSGAKSVCDVGGGANPVLSPEFIAATGLRYLLVDVSGSELALAPPSYDKLVLDLETAVPSTFPSGFDLALSSYVLEHISAPEAFHNTVRNMLAPSGRAAHFFSTLYSLPFLVNRLLPHRLAASLAMTSLPERDAEGHQGVFPARYRWCRGPTVRQIRRFESVGFEVETYTGYFGHSYFRRIGPMQRLEYALADQLVRHPVPALTSFAYVSLVRRG